MECCGQPMLGVTTFADLAAGRCRLLCLGCGRDEVYPERMPTMATMAMPRSWVELLVRFPEGHEYRATGYARQVTLDSEGRTGRVDADILGIETSGGEPPPERTLAQMLALAVLNGDADVALALADLVASEFTGDRAAGVRGLIDAAVRERDARWQAAAGVWLDVSGGLELFERAARSGNPPLLDLLRQGETPVGDPLSWDALSEADL